jgi:hypothetical protein
MIILITPQTFTTLTKLNLVHKSVFRFMQTQPHLPNSPAIQDDGSQRFQNIPLDTFSPAGYPSPTSILSSPSSTAPIYEGGSSSSSQPQPHQQHRQIIDDENIDNNVVNNNNVNVNNADDIVQTLPPIIVRHHEGLEYPQPVVVPPDTIGPGNFTLDDCMQRPLDVVTFNADNLPVTQSMFDNLAKAAAYICRYSLSWHGYICKYN